MSHNTEQFLLLLITLLSIASWIGIGLLSRHLSKIEARIAEMRIMVKHIHTVCGCGD